MNKLKDLKKVRLNGELDTSSCANLMEATEKYFNQPKEISIIADEINTKFVKKLLKSYNWTYKDLADHIGAVETTVRNWMSKGEIPDWAKLSIGYIATIDELECKYNSKDMALDDIRENLRAIMDFVAPRDEDEDEPQD